MDMNTVEEHSAKPTVGTGLDEIVVSVVIPCLNEEQAIERCVRLAREVLDAHDISGEIIVADNDSEDQSPLLAAKAGAIVVHEPRRGYGSAYLAGFGVARGRYIVMVDADLTYDFNEIPKFVAKLDAGADMVIGNRMQNIQPGAMPWLHRYVGNPLLSGFLNLLFRTGVDDAHCGMRAVRRARLAELDLRTTGMEFASEMVIRASKQKLTLAQFPIEYHPREGESKLSSFRDGWRHLRFLLVHAPDYLFIFPGALMTLVGGVVEIIVTAHLGIFGRYWDIHAVIAGALLAIVGTQVLALGICAHTYATYYMSDHDPWFDWVRARFKLEHGLLAGSAVLLVGVGLGIVIVVNWANHGFGRLSFENLAILAATLIIIGVQAIFSSFLISILGLRRER